MLSRGAFLLSAFADGGLEGLVDAAHRSGDRNLHNSGSGETGDCPGSSVDEVGGIGAESGSGFNCAVCASEADGAVAADTGSLISSRPDELVTWSASASGKELSIALSFEVDTELAVKEARWARAVGGPECADAELLLMLLKALDCDSTPKVSAVLTCNSPMARASATGEMSLCRARSAALSTLAHACRRCSACVLRCWPSSTLVFAGGRRLMVLTSEGPSVSEGEADLLLGTDESILRSSLPTEDSKFEHSNRANSLQLVKLCSDRNPVGG